MVCASKRRGDHPQSGEREQLVLGADENLDPVAGLSSMQKLDHVGFGLEVREQSANALEVLRSVDVAKKVGLPANDQLVARFPAPGPRGEASFDQTGGDVVELLARVLAGGFDLRRHFGQRAASNTSVEKVTGLNKRRRGHAGRRGDPAV